MGCYICDRPLDDILIDSRDNKLRPCDVCERIVLETAMDWDRPLGTDDITGITDIEDFIELDTFTPALP